MKHGHYERGQCSTIGGFGQVTLLSCPFETVTQQGLSVGSRLDQGLPDGLGVVRKLQETGVRALAFRSDQGDTSAAKPLVEAVVAHFGKLDILMNNAAIAVQGKTVDDPELDADGLDRQWRTNVLGAVATTRAAASRLSDGGRIVFIGSGLGSRVAFPGVADYAGTKAAIVGYAKGVGRDLGPRNITENVVQPGIIPTDMAADVAGELPDAIMDLHAIRRIATVEEVAAAVCFLAGPDAGYITGGVLDVSGGYQI